jgi:hypothetical protein
VCFCAGGLSLQEIGLFLQSYIWETLIRHHTKFPKALFGDACRCSRTISPEVKVGTTLHRLRPPRISADSSQSFHASVRTVPSSSLALSQWDASSLTSTDQLALPQQVRNTVQALLASQWKSQANLETKSVDTVLLGIRVACESSCARTVLGANIACLVRVDAANKT